MQIELKRIQHEVGLTFIHVTHEQEEAMTMADRIAVMNGGVIEQSATRRACTSHAATTFVANFLGQSNLLTATARGAGEETWCRVRSEQLRLEVSRSTCPMV